MWMIGNTTVMVEAFRRIDGNLNLLPAKRTFVDQYVGDV
jgi:hypothetical protein